MDGKSISNVEDVQYFLARIKEFEKKYGMDSWQFQVLYENSRTELVGYSGLSAVDYSEWAFLYENFYSRMSQTLYESPPEVVNDTDQHKPEHRSGLCFSGGKGDQLCGGISRPCPNSFICQD
jgi:hypothetical protein